MPHLSGSYACTLPLRGTRRKLPVEEDRENLWDRSQQSAFLPKDAAAAFEGDLECSAAGEEGPAMKCPVISLGLALFSVFIIARAEGPAPSMHASVGLGHGVNVPGDESNSCIGTLYANHDSSFENGYAWAYGGTAPPYYGAFAEGFAGGGGDINCVQLRLTTLPGYYTGQTLDVYVWGSDGGQPSNVLSVTPGVQLGSPPAIWPDVSTHDIEDRERASRQ
jgi:hypothetical protein